MLSGKKAIVTGASRGIGRAIAIKFAENGAFVGINYLHRREKAEEVLKEVMEYGDGVLLEGDVSDYKIAEEVVGKFVDIAGRVDILVNNAGIYERKKFHELDEHSWDKTIKNNLKSCYIMSKLCVNYMSEGGKIIFISSQLALKGSTHGADYAASKAGILGLMRSLALELAPLKINVNAIAPGTIDTDIIASYSQEERKEREKQIPLGRIGKPEDIANACLFLASSMADYITGETLNVNGGLYIQ